MMERMKEKNPDRNEHIGSGQILIVSYSYSGNTHRIAQEIQKATGGDWSEIYPWQPYPIVFPELLLAGKKGSSITVQAQALSNFTNTTSRAHRAG